MAVNEPYALMVQPDDILISPREVDEHFGTMVSSTGICGTDLCG